MKYKQFITESKSNTWYYRFLNDLEHEYYDEIAWILMRIGANNDEGIGVSVYKPLINRYKREIIKEILKVIANKELYINWTAQEQDYMINGIKKLNMDWPEIDIIQRSLDADKINEAEHYSDEEDFASREFNFSFRQLGTDLSGLDSILDKLYYRDISDKVIYTIVMDHYEDIVYWFKEVESSNTTDEVMEFIWDIFYNYDLIKIPSVIQELQPILNNRKTEVLDWLLKKIEDTISNNSNIQSLVKNRNILKQIVDWPELSTNIEYYINQPKAKKIIITNLLKLIKKNLNTSNDFYLPSIKYILEQLDSIDIHWPELDTIKQSLKADNPSLKENSDYDEGRKMIIDIVQQQVTRSSRGIFYVMYYLDKWGLHLKDWPEIRELIDNQKKLIITDILKAMKDASAESISYCKFVTDRMFKIGIDWPELQIIKNSVDAESRLSEQHITSKKQIHEVIFKNQHPFIKHAADKIKEKLSSPINDDSAVSRQIQFLTYYVDPQEVYDGMKHLAPDLAKWFSRLFDKSPDFALDELRIVTSFMSDLYPEIRQVLDKNKEIIIRNILKKIKASEDDYELSRILQQVKDLNLIGLDWKELETIKNSLTAG